MRHVQLHHFRSLNIAFTSLGVVMVLIVLKYFIHQFHLEFLTINTLTGSAIAGGVFICSFLLSGVITDYKEAEKIPAELRSSIENVWDEAQLLHTKNKKFKVEPVRKQLLDIIKKFFTGLGQENEHKNLTGCLASVDAFRDRISDMEQKGMLPNFLVRVKTEVGNIRKCVLRVYQIQRTQFIPSAFFLGLSIVFLIISILLFVKTEGSPESMILFGLIGYMFIYIINLIAVIEQPYRQGDATLDDISLFLLHELEDSLSVK